MRRDGIRGLMAHHAGASAEAQIARQYEQQGLDILHQRWRGAGGEIDLILRNAGMVVFVEVKKSKSLAQAAERITPRQVARIRAAAGAFLAAELEGEPIDVRFDAALLGTSGEIEILENAF
jgi:putative endonuclease